VNEDEWLNCKDPQPMLQFLRGKASDRKLRLFACACCRRGWRRITVPRIKELVEIAEQYADRTPTENEWLTAWHSVSAMYFTSNVVWPNAWEAASRVSEGWLHISGDRKPRRQNRHRVEMPAQCGVLRDIFGNPFQPWFVSSAWLTWNDTTIPRLARAVHDERAFDRLPILADALEDAECSDTDLLNHLRSPEAHFLGCWAVDLLLAKK
jgi:hypothetical protein